METTLQLTLTGTRPMLMHNGRLSNPLDPHTRAVAAIAKKRQKTDKDHAELAGLEARGAMYETVDGRLGLPTANVWRCLYDAAKAYKLGESVKQALLCELEIEPLMINGQTWPCDTYIGEDAARLSYVPVVINRRRTMRARPVILAGWTASFRFVLMTEILEPQRLKPVIERAGLYVGLGDWRPLHGLFTATMTLEPR